MDLLLDADAAVAMRGLKVGAVSFLDRVLATSVGVAFTGYVYEHELRSPQDLEAHRQAGRLTVHHVMTRTPAFERRRELIKRGLDKGEAEAIAWLLDDSARAETIAFVTFDRLARKVATESHLRVVDVAETAAALVAASLLDVGIVRAHLSVWDDARNQSGRPKKWRSFEEDFPGLIADARARNEGA